MVAVFILTEAHVIIIIMLYMNARISFIFPQTHKQHSAVVRSTSGGAAIDRLCTRSWVRLPYEEKHNMAGDTCDCCHGAWDT